MKNEDVQKRMDGMHKEINAFHGYRFPEKPKTKREAAQQKAVQTRKHGKGTGLRFPGSLP